MCAHILPGALHNIPIRAGILLQGQPCMEKGGGPLTTPRLAHSRAGSPSPGGICTAPGKVCACPSGAPHQMPIRAGILLQGLLCKTRGGSSYNPSFVPLDSWIHGHSACWGPKRTCVHYVGADIFACASGKILESLQREGNPRGPSEDSPLGQDAPEYLRSDGPKTGVA